MSNIAPYKALALQLTCNAVNKLSAVDIPQFMLAQLHSIKDNIIASKRFIGNDLKLVVLPEYFLTGFPMGETIKEWKEKACIAPNSTVHHTIGAIAKEADVYLSGNVYETDEHFPDLYFQVSFIYNPDGECILRYRRLNSMYAPTPYDVLDKYIAIYGKESLFPVAKTPIGNLACIASEEILYPEIARCLMANGAEVLLHSSSEIGSALQSQKNIAKLARAIENSCYVLSANSAGIINTAIPAQSTDGHSQVVNYEGIKLAEAGYGESMVANATIHIEALRQHRLRPGMSNFISRQRWQLFEDTYKKVIQPANALLHTKADRSFFVMQQQQVIQTLIKQHIIEP